MPANRGPRVRPAVAALVAAALLPLGVTPAVAAAAPRTAFQAKSSGTAQADAARQRADQAASRARARVDALLERYQDASALVDVQVAALSTAFADGAAAEVDHEAAAARQRRIMVTQSAQIRAVYASGGPAGLTMSVLGASSPSDALWRASTADRVLGVLLADTKAAVLTETELKAQAQRRVTAADNAVDAQAQALEELQVKATVAATALTQAQSTLSRLDVRARQAKAAQESARQIAAAQAAARVARQQAMGTVTALGIPAEYQQAYQAAALTCPGMSWTLLAGVGQIETAHGRNSRPSSAGALGPMQFMPRTFAAYAVDGDHDGVLDVWDPQDAIFSAAHYLCASGTASKAEAGSAAWKHAALLAYNHAEWYVDLVLAAEQAIIAKTQGLPGLP